MKPAYFQSQNSGRDRWMVSYLDVLTILLILFVAMAAQSLQSAQQVKHATLPQVSAPHAALAAIRDVLNKIPNNVRLVGHSDAIPIHNRRFRNNWELAAARGLRLLELLAS